MVKNNSYKNSMKERKRWGGKDNEDISYFGTSFLIPPFLSLLFLLTSSRHVHIPVSDHSWMSAFREISLAELHQLANQQHIRRRPVASDVVLRRRRARDERSGGVLDLLRTVSGLAVGFGLFVWLVGWLCIIVVLFGVWWMYKFFYLEENTVWLMF